MAIIVDQQPYKIEIVSEGRIALTGVADPTLPVDRLTDSDLVAEKLLANDDGCLDESVHGRDAMDLVLLEHTLGEMPEAAWTKARAAYGDSIDRTFRRALERLRDRAELTERWFDLMQVSPEGRRIVRQRLQRL